MAPNGNTRWPHTALLTRSTSGPERQYRWPPKAQILSLPPNMKRKGFRRPRLSRITGQVRH